MSATRPPMHDDRTTGTADAASRRGAHRARTKPFSAGLPVLAGIAVILLVVGGIYFVLGNGGGSPSSNDGTVAAEPTPTENLPSAASTAGGSPSTSTSTSTSTSPDETTTKPSATDTGDSGSTDVDKSVSLVVLNSTGVKGLASRGESALVAKGWKVGRTGNSINQGLSVTKIYYGNSDKEETADAVRTDLGYGQVFQDSSVTKKGITIVLGHDAE